MKRINRALMRIKRAWAHTPAIPATQKEEMGRIVKVSLGKKIVRPHLSQQAGVVALTCDPRYMGSCRQDK
jgi:hypothetical protein